MQTLVGPRESVLIKQDVLIFRVSTFKGSTVDYRGMELYSG